MTTDTTTVTMTDYQKYILQSRYSRYLPEKRRRENFDEVINRYLDFFENHLRKTGVMTPELRTRLFDAIHRMEVMPSMRAMMSAGEALLRDNVAAYNCCFLAIDSWRAFPEILYILMCGTGVGFSVERQFTDHFEPLPVERLYVDGTVRIQVADSRDGWRLAFEALLRNIWVDSRIPLPENIDYSQVRPRGARLKTFGGRASGPEPLKSLFDKVISLAIDAMNERRARLTSLELHDLVCSIADIVIVGGVRRSALISFSDVDDDAMRDAKSVACAWWIDQKQRALANNTAVFTDRPSREAFDKEFNALVASGSGERGIFNNQAIIEHLRAECWRRYESTKYGTLPLRGNPCFEILLVSMQFCNLTEPIVRPSDTFEQLKEKIELATILGTFQASLTDFGDKLRSEWKANTEREALLGVSLSGILDHPVLNMRDYLSGVDKETVVEWLHAFRQHAIEVNSEYASLIGIQPSRAITCIKPSGTVSQLVDCASGIHARHAPFYIRRVRANQTDPLAKMMRDMGVPCEVDVMKPDDNFVFSFPMRAPSTSVLRNEYSAIEQLRIFLLYQEHYCEHKPSVTISVREDEWEAVREFMWVHFDRMTGVSFLPYSEHIYQQAPYEEIDEEKYNEMCAYFDTSVRIDWTKLGDYEEFDDRQQSNLLSANDDSLMQQAVFACTANGCEI